MLLRNVANRIARVRKENINSKILLAEMRNKKVLIYQCCIAAQFVALQKTL